MHALEDDPRFDRPVPPVDLEADRGIERPLARGLRQFAVHAERDAERAPRSSGEGEPSVAVAASHRPHVGEPRRWDEQPHLGVADPERAEPAELLGNVEAKALAPHDRVDWLRCRSRVGSQDGGRVLAEGTAERVDAGAVDLDPRRRTVPSVGDEVVTAGAERRQQVEARVASPRPSPPPPGAERDEDGRHEMLLGEAGGDDADDPRMPPLAGEDERGAARQLGRERRPSPLRLRQHLRLDLAALAVCPVEVRGDRLGAGLVGGQHQLHRGVGSVQAPGGVDAGAQAKRQIALVEARRADPGRGAQRAQAEPLGPPGELEPAPNERAVLAPQRHEVGDRRESDQVEIRGGPFEAVEGVRELVGHAGRAELRARVARDGGMEGWAAREVVGRLMVVGDDHLHPVRERGADLGGAADPAVDGD